MMFDDEVPGPIDEATATATERPAIFAPGRHRADPPPPSAPPAYRVVVAGWPEEWRERWGRRANELEDSGLSWRDAESQAFVEVWNLAREGREPLAPSASGSDPKSDERRRCTVPRPRDHLTASSRSGGRSSP